MIKSTRNLKSIGNELFKTADSVNKPPTSYRSRPPYVSVNKNALPYVLSPTKARRRLALKGEALHRHEDNLKRLELLRKHEEKSAILIQVPSSEKVWH